LVSGTRAALPVGTASVNFLISVFNISEGDTIDLTLDDIHLEKSPFPTPYFDGSTSDSENANTYAWTGAANASTSMRAASRLRIPLPTDLAPAMTVATRFSPLWGATGATGEKILFTFADGNIVLEASNNTILFNYNGADGSAGTGAQTFSAGSVNSAIARAVRNGTVDLMVDGVAAAQDISAGSPVVAYSSVQIGDYWTEGYSARSYIGPALFSPQRKSDAWTVAMDALLRSSDIDLYKIKRDFMSPGDALFSGLQVDGSKLFIKGS
jgi:hypothetical protein